MARIIFFWGGEKLPLKRERKLFPGKAVLRVPGKVCANSGLWDFGTWRHFHLDAGILPDSLQIPSVPSPGSQELGTIRFVRSL